MSIFDDLRQNLKLLVSNPGQFAQGAKLGAQARVQQVKAVPQAVQRIPQQIGQSRFNLPAQIQAVRGMNPQQAQQFRHQVDTFGNYAKLNLPKYQSPNPVKSFAFNLPGNIVESTVNAIPNAALSLAKLPAARNKKQVAADIAGIAEAPLNFATFGAAGSVAKQAGKAGLKQALKQGIKSGTAAGASFGLTGGLQQGQNIGSDTQYARSLAGNVGIGALTGGLLGGAVGAGGFAAGNLWKGMVSSAPGRTPQEQSANAQKFLRDEIGRFTKKGNKVVWAGQEGNGKNSDLVQLEPEWYGDMRVRLGLPKDGKYKRELLDKYLGNQQGFIKLGSEEFASSLGKPSTPGIPGKQRGLITNVQNSPKSSPALAEGVSGTYTPVSNKESLAQAKNLVSTNYSQARDLVFDRTTAPNAVTTATALEMTDQAQKAGRIDEAIDIVNSYAERLTQSGQAAQAASIWSRLSPVSVLRKVNQDYKTATGKPLPPEIGTRITNLAKELDTLPEGPEKLFKTTQLYKEMAGAVPSGLGSKLTNLWKATLLTATRTHLVNLISTSAFQTLENVSKGLGTIVDLAASVGTGKRSVNLSGRNLLEQAKAIPQGLKDAKTVFKTGANPTEVASLDTVKSVNYGKSVIGKALNAYTQSVFRSLGAADALMKAPALKSSLLEQAELEVKNQGLRGNAAKAAIDVLFNHPTEDMAKKAYEAAQFATFNNPNAISRAVSGAKTIGGKPAEVAIDLTIPFVRTPSNVAGRLVDYSPVGLLGNVARGIANKDQRQIVMGLSRGAVGSSVIAAGAVLASNGLLTGKYPSDRTEQARWEAEGRKPNSILVDGAWRQLSAVSPLGNLLGVGADVFNLATEAGKSGTDLVASTAASAVNTLSNQTFLKGLSGTVNAVVNPEQYGGSALNSFAGSFVPAISGAVARGLDPQQREVSSPTDAIASRIPGLSQTLPGRVDVTGQDVKRDGGLIGQFFDPFNSSKNRPNPVLDEVKRLRKVDSSLNISRPGDSVKGFDVGKEGINRINKEAGSRIDATLNKFVSNPKWAEIDDTTKIKLIRKVIDTNRDAVRTAIWTEEVVKQYQAGTLREKIPQILNSYKSLSSAEKKYFLSKLQEAGGNLAQGGN